jgi:hypothetical protein
LGRQSADFEEPTMTDDIIDLSEYQRTEHDRLLRLREIFLNQERNERNGELPPITRHLNNLDRVLSEDQLTGLSLHIEIIARAAYVTALQYKEEPEPLIKHLLLLCIRQHHRQFMKLPCAEALAGIWGEWLHVLEEEEEECAYA